MFPACQLRRFPAWAEQRAENGCRQRLDIQPNGDHPLRRAWRWAKRGEIADADANRA